jgi:hypothetical protein
MKSFTRSLLCFFAGVILCHCSGDGEKTAKKDTASMSLAQRSMLKPDENQRSRYEKYITDPKSKGTAGSYFQNQKHNSKNFNGGDSYARQKQFKTNQSWFGKSKNKSADMTYSLGDRQATGVDGKFKTETSRFGDRKAAENGSVFSGADNVFKTSSALPRSQRTAREPLIIENYNDQAGKPGAYTEAEVKKLLNRN